MENIRTYVYCHLGPFRNVNLFFVVVVFQQFTDTGFTALARNCHLLERLDLEECVLITDSALSVLSACCPRLEFVSLSHCELVTDEGIRQV